MKIYDLKEAFGLAMEGLDIPYPEMSLEDLQVYMTRNSQPLVWLTKNESTGAKACYRARHASDLLENPESVTYLDTSSDGEVDLPQFIVEYIEDKGIRVLNVSYPDWIENLKWKRPVKWRVNVLGLGDVGGTLLTGLRLMGHGVIDEIGLFDLDVNRRRRWALELGQILDPNIADYPTIKEIEMDDLFDCDMFVFCASRSVPEVGSDVKDVRMIQYESNSKIIEPYAQMAREKGFKGIFAVVSDPVDQLCYRVYHSSNVDANGSFDGQGLKPEQVRGYGLGVMFARASYYAQVEQVDFSHGRAYGPHGKELIVVNNPQKYDPALSEKLTKMTVEANLEVREAGYKPFIAPALSSGALSLINTMKGKWHDSAVMLGGVYIGCRNKLSTQGVQVERQDVDPKVIGKLNDVAKVLKSYV